MPVPTSPWAAVPARISLPVVPVNVPSCENPCVTVSVLSARSTTALLPIVRYATLAFAGSTGSLVTLGIVRISPLPGISEGVQLSAVAQSVVLAPVQVRDTSVASTENSAGSAFSNV